MVSLDWDLSNINVNVFDVVAKQSKHCVCAIVCREEETCHPVQVSGQNYQKVTVLLCVEFAAITKKKKMENQYVEF